MQHTNYCTIVIHQNNKTENDLKINDELFIVLDTSNDGI